MNNKNKQGQATVEYMSTYGFAFLAMLIGFGAMVYLGLFNTDALRAQECTFTPGITCTDFVLEGNSLSVVIRNDFGVPINFTDSPLVFEYQSAFYACSLSNTALPSDASVQISCSFDQAQRGDRYDGVIRLSFTREGHTYEHPLVGWVSVLAQ